MQHTELLLLYCHLYNPDCGGRKVDGLQVIEKRSASAAAVYIVYSRLEASEMGSEYGTATDMTHASCRRP